MDPQADKKKEQPDYITGVSSDPQICNKLYCASDPYSSCY